LPAFAFGNPPDTCLFEELKESNLRKLIYVDQTYRHLRTTRILRLYLENVVMLVKPDRLRYWIRSTAVRDADETIIELQGQGY
jgi:hypothetical protein